MTAWDNKGNVADGCSWFESGIGRWKAKWLEADLPGACYADPKDDYLMPAVIFRKVFTVQKGVKGARMYATAHGVYTVKVNGRQPDERLLAPEFSSYQDCLYYQIYDVTKLLREGKNVCSFEVADGWWMGRIGMTGECGQFGSSRAILFQIQVLYEDGFGETIVSDEDVRCTMDGCVRYSDLFIGEKQDHHYPDGVWDSPTYEDEKSGENRKAEKVGAVGMDKTAVWGAVKVAEYGYENLRPQNCGYIRKIKEMHPQKLIVTPKGEVVVDFGQVMAGFVQVRAEEKPDTVITLEHSEVLNEEGNFLNNIMGGNKDQKDVFICKGEGTECFEPRYTFHGFRYVKVSGMENLGLERFTAYQISSDMEELAEFRCGNEKLNQLYSNVRWSQYSNMISIPTDCPQREKAGWTGDIAVYAPTACFHQNMRPFLSRWLESVAAEQYEDGQVPNVVPYNPSYKNLLGRVFGSDCSAGWGDACIIVPYVLYQRYGDKRILEKNYPTMRKWMDYAVGRVENHVPKEFDASKATERERENQKYLWNTDWHFGDWMIPSLSKGPRGGVDGAMITKELVASIYYAYENQLMGEISRILGYQEEADEFSKRHARVIEAVGETYVNEDGTLTADLQGCYVLALWHGVVPESKQAGALRRLERLIEENHGCLDTGFLATPVLLDVLTEYGKLDEAYRLLYQEECPSWIYEINKGATSIWESWDGIEPSGNVGCLSYNHYALGSVMDWVYRVMAGIQAASPGYQDIVIWPRPDERTGWVECSHESVYGKISSVWRLNGTEFELDVEIPCNTAAQIVLPDHTRYRVGSGKYHYKCTL